MDKLKADIGDAVVPVKLDVTDADSVSAAAAVVGDTLADRGAAGLDGLVNNAGILVSPGPVEWTPIESYRKMLEVNLVGMAAVTKSVLPYIRSAAGRVVNVASIAGRVGLPTQPAYCASKYAVEGYSEVLRRDLLPWGVTVHVVEPGVFPNTGLYAQYQKGLDKLWADLPDALKAEYGESFYQATRSQMGKALTDLGNSDSSLVPEAMVHALTAESPQYRYRVGNDSKYLITAIEHMRESTSDWLFTRGNMKADRLPAAAPRDGFQISTGRYESPWGGRLKTMVGLLGAGAFYEFVRWKVVGGGSRL